jgi:lysyl-tRNA synthetase class 2
MVCGRVANAYSELNDPIDQRNDLKSKCVCLKKEMMKQTELLMKISWSIRVRNATNSGLGIGMDRLMMYLTNNSSIQEVLLFPQMRPEKTG